MDRNLIEQSIISTEWDMFQQVKNIDGRAECQDEYETFVINRLSQFESWPIEVIGSYLLDLEDAVSNGRNLVMEKYAYMMEMTDPEYFSSIKHLLPKIEDEKKILIDAIVGMYMRWEKEVAALYPNVRKAGRPASEIGEDKFNSVENYLRCELCTYSFGTLDLLHKKIMQNPKNNLYWLSLQKMAQAYGYEDLEAAEKALRKQHFE